MNELERYKAIAKAAEVYRNKYMTLSENLAKSLIQASKATFMKEAASLKVDTAWVSEFQSNISMLSKAVNSPAVELARAANVSISRMVVETVRPMRELADQISTISEAWKEKLQPTHALMNSIAAPETALRAHLANISKVTILAQGSLSRFPFEEVGKALRIGSRLRETLSKGFLNFSRSYSNLFTSFEKTDLGIFSSPPVISELPSFEFFNASDLLQVITVEDDEKELAEEKQQACEEIRDGIEETLPIRLAELDEELIPLWQGAKRALHSSNPDRVRHFAISLRELLTHVLHRLAPDDEVREWSTRPEHFSDNRPTRMARLLYICRDINHGPFVDFVEKDVAAVSAFVKLFQRGTHEIKSAYTQKQLLALRTRMESTIRFLLEISRENN